MTVLVTGVAGFIGYHVAEALLARGQSVVGVDNLNDYYEVSLKQARLARLRPRRVSHSASSTSPTAKPCRRWAQRFRASRMLRIWARSRGCAIR